jgi:5'-methylthioadenosine phosphorylase
MSEDVKIAVIGGSGLYQMEELTDRTAVPVDTPYGKPSADIIIGTLRGQRVAFLPRHGEGHVYSPSTVPYRANIYALKSLGVRFIIGVNACGSLKEEYAPGHIVIPDQVYDQTKADRGGRSFFESGLVGHISVADPFCPELAELLHTSVQQAGGTVHKGGTFIIIEGPRFSTRGESHIYRQWGCSIIGMTTTPEVFLAREAEIAYASMAHITDYDVWHVSEEPVTVEMVIRIMKRNLETAQKAIAIAVENLDAGATYDAHNALGSALMTARDKIPAALLEQLKPIVGRYFGSSV